VLHHWQFVDFPEDLKAIMNGHTAVICGGLQMHVTLANMIMNTDTFDRDGRLINDIREHEILEQADIIRSKGLKNIVLVGICKYSVQYLPDTLKYYSRFAPRCGRKE
jgi:hypothetical protein